jgi:hypothetical protein
MSATSENRKENQCLPPKFSSLDNSICRNFFFALLRSIKYSLSFFLDKHRFEDLTKSEFDKSFTEIDGVSPHVQAESTRRNSPSHCP